jgi:hypothetical protein
MDNTNPYKEYPNISKCTIDERIEFMTKSAINLLESGEFSMDEVKETIDYYEANEMYEALVGLKKAIHLHKFKNKNK